MILKRIFASAATAGCAMALVATGASAHWAGGSLAPSLPTSATGHSALLGGSPSLHSHLNRSRSGATNLDPVLPAPICVLGTGALGAAKGLIPSTAQSYDGLNLLAFGLSSDSKNITGELKVANLAGNPLGGPNIVGTGNDYYIYFSYAGTPYFLHAQYGAPVDSTGGTTPPVATSGWNFFYGHSFYPGGQTAAGAQLTDDGDAAGTIDTKTGIIKITVSMNRFASVFLPAGETAGNAFSPGQFVDTIRAESDYETGAPGISGPGAATFVNTAQTITTAAKFRYTIGTLCPAS